MTQVDLQLSPDGDLVLTAEGDLALISDHSFVMQQVAYRLKSTEPEIFREQNICANLFELRGRLNSRETADEGVLRIVRALTSDGLIATENLMVRAYPVSDNSISWFVFVNKGGAEAEGFAVDLDFNRGVIVRGVRE